jgi:hypothetical protein
MMRNEWPEFAPLNMMELAEPPATETMRSVVQLDIDLVSMDIDSTSGAAWAIGAPKSVAMMTTTRAAILLIDFAYMRISQTIDLGCLL